MPKRILASPHTVEEVGRRSVDEGPREAGIGRGGRERTSKSVASLAACYRRSRTPQRGRGAPRSGDRPADSENELRTPSLASPHAVEEVRVALRPFDLVEQKFHRLELVHRVEQFAQYPHFLQDIRLQQQLLAPRAGAVDVDGW